MLSVTETLISRNIRRDSEKKRVRALVENLAIALANSRVPESDDIARPLCTMLVLRWQKAAPTDQGKQDLLTLLRAEMGNEGLVQLAAEFWEHPLPDPPDPFKAFVQTQQSEQPQQPFSQKTKKKRVFNSDEYIDFAVDFFHPYKTRSCVYAFLGHGYVGFSRGDAFCSKIQAQLDLAVCPARPAKIQEFTNSVLNEISPMMPADRGYVPLYNQVIKVNFDALRQLPLAALECSELAAARGTSQSMLSMEQLLNNKVIEVQPMTPELGLTAAHPLRFDPYAEHPQVAELYSLVSKDDAETCARLEEAAGLAVYRGSDLRSFGLLDGPPGSGKSLFLQSISAMCGNTVQYIGLEEFGEQFAGELGRDHEVFISDDQGNKPLPAKALSFLNTGTSGNPRYFNGKYIRPGDYTGRQVFLVACNTLPNIDENSVLDRMLLIEVDGRANTITNWSALFRDSKFLSAYFNRALRGALRMVWRKEHAAGKDGKVSYFTACSKSEEALLSYKTRSDLVCEWYSSPQRGMYQWKYGEAPFDSIQFSTDLNVLREQRSKTISEIIKRDQAEYNNWAAGQLGHKYFERRDKLTEEKYKHAHERFFPFMVYVKKFYLCEGNVSFKEPKKLKVTGYILPEDLEKFKHKGKTRGAKKIVPAASRIPEQPVTPSLIPAGTAAAPIATPQNPQLFWNDEEAAAEAEWAAELYDQMAATVPAAAAPAEPAEPAVQPQQPQPQQSQVPVGRFINGQPVPAEVFFNRTQPPFSDIPDEPDIDDDDGQGGAS